MRNAEIGADQERHTLFVENPCNLGKASDLIHRLLLRHALGLNKLRDRPFEHADDVFQAKLSGIDRFFWRHAEWNVTGHVPANRARFGKQSEYAPRGVAVCVLMKSTPACLRKSAARRPSASSPRRPRWAPGIRCIRREEKKGIPDHTTVTNAGRQVSHDEWLRFRKGLPR